MPPKSSSRFGLIAVVVLVLVLAAAAGGAWYFLGTGAGTASASAPAPAAPPPTPVVVRTVVEQKLRIWNEYSGRMNAVDYAEIRPEVSGRITEVRFQDGQQVKAGDILFVIDPRPYEAAQARAQARIASAKATIEFTKADQARNQALLKTQAIAQREVDQANSAFDAASAELQSAEADLKTAEVDLDHAYVKAPIAGRVSRAEITLGNRVESGAGAPLLTSVVSRDGIYADFEVDEQTYLDTIRNAANGNAQESLIPVRLVLQGDAKDHAYDGFIQSFDNRLDTASGTIRARARFENADGTLVPGMFVSVKLASSREQDVLLVPERALGSDQSKKFVYVVGPGNKVAYREVELGSSVGSNRIATKGLQSGDRVVVDGVQRIRPDAVVAATELPADPAPASGGGNSKHDALAQTQETTTP